MLAKTRQGVSEHRHSLFAGIATACSGKLRIRIWSQIKYASPCCKFHGTEDGTAYQYCIISTPLSGYAKVQMFIVHLI
ncbi:MAG: hypothetical protein WBP64_12735 [Nitrososphaeraceae archaeon]